MFEFMKQQKSIDRPNNENGTGNFQTEDATHGRTSVRCRFNQTVFQPLHHQESKFVDL